MNSTPQLDLHPDAESLNAFAEQALSAPEREQVLAHLAGCSRCRQVIFLAQQAAVDAKAPAPVPAARLKVRFWTWRFAWVPAAAMAAALALVVTLHIRHTEPAAEMAKITPPPDEAVSASLPQQRTGAKAAHKPAPALVANSLAGKSEYAARREPSEEFKQESAPSAAPPAEPGASAPLIGASGAFLPSPMESASQPETAQVQPQPAVAAWRQEQLRSSGTLSASADASRQTSQKSMSAEAYSAHASRKAASAGPRMVQQSQAVPASSFDIVTQQQLAGSAASRKANPPNLPSGLAALSRATAQHLMLEIDQAGVLFLSDDYGLHWVPVTQQWTGRAIEVRAIKGLSGNTAPATSFELQNQAGSTWASTDGKTWTAR
ncbi:MAG: zf-HC2 domain-containing protein [Terracidiphilus sp.]